MKCIKSEYGYAVYDNGKIPLHVVQINSSILSSFCVFNSSKDAVDYIKELKFWIPDLVYNPDFIFFSTLLKMYIHADCLFSALHNRQIYINYNKQ